jgi:hypothetical protein
MRPANWLAVACAALCFTAGAVRAHDSWLSPADGGALALATGNRYPVPEVAPAAASIARSACSDGEDHALPLRPVRERALWLELKAGATDSALAPLSCWAELQAVEIELPPRLVEVYLAEIRPPAAVRTAWAQLQARGLPWRERYRKFARIESVSAADVPPGLRTAARRPTGMEMEIVVLGEAPIAVGQPLELQVLRDGRPLPGFAVELVSERSTLGVWRETDAQGVLGHRLPFGGRWLLRGTDLRPSSERPGAWDSRFVTLAIEAR